MKGTESICPVCEEYYFEYPDDYDICPICGWENDGLQREQKDYWGGANSFSLNEAKAVYKLLKDTENRYKVSQLIDGLKKRNREIHNQYRDIDHRTAKGEECRGEFAQAHNDFVIELGKLSKTLH